MTTERYKMTKESSKMVNGLKLYRAQDCDQMVAYCRHYLRQCKYIFLLLKTTRMFKMLKNEEASLTV